ncbi:MAG TPA: gluconate 2-dehydrogenase subunit 3 family protein [Rhodanobacteraceae bacterium]
MPDRYPGYDVLKKRDTPSWNAATRHVVDARLAIVDAPQFFNRQEWLTLRAICDGIVPQRSPAQVPIAAMVDRKFLKDRRDGYRDARLPPQREAWQRGLAALETVAQTRAKVAFHQLTALARDALLQEMQDGKLDGPEWGGMPAALFFRERVTHDILAAYYSHPTAWNEIGFGGPAAPRGYVRMYFNRRDPWEAAEAHDEDEAKTGTADARARIS